MYYRISNKPANPSARHNKISWDRIKHLKDKHTLQGFASYVKDHDAPETYQTGDQNGDCMAFVIYALKGGWIVAVES